MALKIPFASTLEILDAIVAAKLDGAKLRQYVNNHTPANGDVTANYTQAAYPGYAEITLTGWPAAALDGSNRASVALALRTWTAGAVVTPEDVFGIYVVSAAGNLLYAEKDPSGPITVSTAGQVTGYVPVFTYKSTN